jgi:Flp pilus assembly protein TadB
MVAPVPSESHRLADSPWFWALLFSLMALAGAALIAPKYEFRQRQVEGRFLGRQAAAIERERRSAGLEPVDLADAARDREEAQPGRIVPLWTLATAAAVAAVASAAMLWRERRRPVRGRAVP